MQAAGAPSVADVTCREAVSRAADRCGSTASGGWRGGRSPHLARHWSPASNLFAVLDQALGISSWRSPARRPAPRRAFPGARRPGRFRPCPKSSTSKTSGSPRPRSRTTSRSPTSTPRTGRTSRRPSSGAECPTARSRSPMVCHDPDAPLVDGFTHWVAYGIDGTAGGLPEGVSDITHGPNDDGQPGLQRTRAAARPRPPPLLLLGLRAARGPRPRRPA